jgi:hypothetical protein
MVLGIDKLIFRMKMLSIFFEVWTEFLNIVYISSVLERVYEKILRIMFEIRKKDVKDV